MQAAQAAGVSDKITVADAGQVLGCDNPAACLTEMAAAPVPAADVFVSEPFYSSLESLPPWSHLRFSSPQPPPFPPPLGLPPSPFPLVCIPDLPSSLTLALSTETHGLLCTFLLRLCNACLLARIRSQIGTAAISCLPSVYSIVGSTIPADSKQAGPYTVASIAVIFGAQVHAQHYHPAC